MNSLWSCSFALFCCCVVLGTCSLATESPKETARTEPTETQAWDSTGGPLLPDHVTDNQTSEGKAESHYNDSDTLPVATNTPEPLSPTKINRVVCVCDLLVAHCDDNCCCDPDCNAADIRGCLANEMPAETAYTEPPEIQVLEGAEEDVPPENNTDHRGVEDSEVIDIGVIASPGDELTRSFGSADQPGARVLPSPVTNNPPALSYITPEVPTASNFDSLLALYGGVSFSTTNSVQNAFVPSATRYEYGSPLLTASAYLSLPAPLGTKECTDRNPVGFLVSQDSTCTWNVSLNNCSVPALTLATYTDVRIIATPNSGNQINITVQSIMKKSLDGIFIPSVIDHYVPVLDNTTELCKDVVLGGSYQILYTEQGAITAVNAFLILGVINATLGTVQQSFKVSFVQDGTFPSLLSGNPGYIVGLPVIAGFKEPQSGIIQNTNRFAQLTILRSSAGQNCLTEEGNRAAVLFGYNMVSGCKLQYPVPCQVAATAILNVLRGQQFPEYVASFGNSQPQNVLDWVPITVVTSTLPQSATADCKIPVSLDLEVRWTKYGSLVNPQAQIVNVTEKITYAFVQNTNSGSGNVLQISTSVTFLDVSAPAQPGYKAPPTIDATLPFDFFRPFV
ncbi:tectonic-1 isoform X1 [Xenopus tropicalis]|uniref:Tectonic-1 isoform X1 n=1 Tax=Xenopus tropicalis TaxID=8364 RepID=A0A8J1J3Y3_XENTR|nr:tectonic-1 isoform X1 [Xenopus tropicalis]